MELALAHPEYGYYMNRDPFGATGDFTTAPEISQMFGELIGLWAAEVWTAMGSPNPVRLIELGPGRGTLMSDALRAARIVPEFRAALDVTLIETSPTLAADPARHAADRRRADRPGPRRLPRRRTARRSSSPTNFSTRCRSGNSCARRRVARAGGAARRRRRTRLRRRRRSPSPTFIAKAAERRRCWK